MRVNRAVLVVLLLSTAYVFASVPLPVVTPTGSNCVFVQDAAAMTLSLNKDCSTSQTIFIPDGYTVLGNKHMIVALADPSTGHFERGAMFKNAGSFAGLKNIMLVAFPGVSGVWFQFASGVIANVDVLHPEEGFIIRNSPLDGNPSPAPQAVEINGSGVYDFSLVGVSASGNLTLTVANSTMQITGGSRDACGMDIGGGAVANINGNSIDMAPRHDINSKAIYLSNLGPGSRIVNNNINMVYGASPMGIFLATSDVIVKGNHVFASASFAGGKGILDFGSNNVITNNTARCYEAPFYHVVGTGNVTLPCPY